MEIQKFNRIPFVVDGVQVDLNNIEEVAEWCGGVVEQRPTRMLGTTTNLPVIKLKSNGVNGQSKVVEAMLGCWVVNLKGSFRVYKPQQFKATFEKQTTDEDILKVAREAVIGLGIDLPAEEATLESLERNASFEQRAEWAEDETPIAQQVYGEAATTDCQA
jgi:hypothetical protein